MTPAMPKPSVPVEFREGTAVELAVAKFRTTGDQAAPMTTTEVGYICGMAEKTIRQYTRDKKIHRRWNVPAGYHPDDVRKFIRSAKTRHGGRRENSPVGKPKEKARP